MGMKCNRILIYMITLAACLLIGISSGQDYLNYGNVNYGRTDDPGLAGMLQWLDQPVYNYPWYTTGGSFYSQPYSETTFSPYREYYTTAGTTVTGGIVSNPTKFDITQKTPSSVYYGAGVGLPYSQYASLLSSKTNDLWIQGTTNWTQYAVVPVGTWLQLIAYTPVGGAAGFYEVDQTDTTISKYMTYQFNPGYNTMNYKAAQVGRHMLYFVVNNQPSNVVVVDVFAQAAASSGVSTYRAGTQKPVNVLGSGTNSGSFVTGRRSYPTPTGYSPAGYNPTGYSTTTTPDGQIVTTSDGKTTITPIGKTTTVSDGTYTTTIGPDGTQTTRTPSGTTVTSGDGQVTTTSSN
jgi:hypothetical protein